MRLGDLGHVLDDVQNNKIGELVQRHARRSMLAIQRQPGTNTVAVADARQASSMPQLQTQIPGVASTSTLMYDRSASIRESVHDVKFTLLLTLVPRRRW